MTTNDEIESRIEFDAYAARYSELLHDPLRSCFAPNDGAFHERKLAVLMRLLARAGVDPATQAWLDVGCGQGTFLDLAGPNFGRAVGCDPSKEMLLPAARFSRILQPSPTSLPFPDHSFDLVTVVCVYHHVEEDAQTPLAREIKRVLKPLIVKRCSIDANAHLLTSFTVKQLFAQTGFLILDTEYFLYLPQFIFRSFGAVERALRRFPYGGQYAVLMQAGYPTGTN